MSFPVFRRRKDEEPISDQQRIKSFFREISHHRMVLFTSPDVDELIKWGRETWREKGKLEETTAGLRSSLERSQEEARGLKMRLGNTEKDLQQTIISLSQLQDNYQALQFQKKKVEEEWKREMEDEKTMHQTILKSKTETYEMKIGDLRTDIMVNQKDSKIWTDDKLKQWLEDLRLKVQDIAPIWLTVPASVPARLDPTGFINRAGTDDFPQLVRSTIWAVLIKHFFSAPFGFGALGPDGRGQLLATYRAWRCLFDSTSAQEDEFALTNVFSESEVANRWRSATFESMYASIMGEDGQGGSTPLQGLYELNVTGAVQRVAAIMADATGAPLRSQELGQLKKAVTLAAQLGLQFGVHTGKLEFTWPEPGTRVVIGKEFMDEREGAMGSGRSVLVDLVVEPGLNRLGNGRGSVQEMVSLLPCQLVPLSS